MNSIIKKYFPVFVIMAMAGLFSCKKEDSVSGPTSKVYFSSFYAEGYSFNLTNTYDLTKVLRDSTLAGDTVFQLPLKVTYPLDRDAVVKIGVDTGYIAQYNKTNGTNYVALSADNYVIEKGEVTIPANAYQSTDSISIRLNMKKSMFRDSVKLLLPIVLKSASGSSAVLSSNLGRMNIIGKVSIKSTNISSDKSAPTTALLSRTNWSITVSNTVSTTYAASKMVDGLTNTTWLGSFSSAPNLVYVTVDLLQPMVVNGVQVFPNFASNPQSYNSAQYEVFVSDDNTNWTSQGIYTYTGPALFTTPAPGNINDPNIIRNIRFFNPVTTRYIRVQLTKNGTLPYSGIGELNLF